MINSDEITIESSSTASKRFEYPKSPDVQVNGSDLTLELIKFERAIKNRITLPLFAAIISLWAPFFTSDFKAIMGLSSKEIKAGYLVFAILLTLLIIKPLFVTVARLMPLLPQYNKRFQNWVRDNECDPETKTKDILNKCFPDQKEK